MRLPAKLGIIATVVASAVAVSASPAYASVSQQRNEAGYTGTSPSAVTKAGGTMNVPTVNCAGTTADNPAMDPSVLLIDPTSLITAQLSLLISCSGGSAVYAGAEGFVFGGSTQFLNVGPVGISPGDNVSFSFVQRWGTDVIKIADVTSHTKAKGQVSPATPPSFTNVVAASLFSCFSGCTPGGNVAPIPSFTDIAFGSWTFNRTTLTGLNSLSESEMFNGSDLQVSTSGIDASGSFSNGFVAAS